MTITRPLRAISRGQQWGVGGGDNHLPAGEGLRFRPVRSSSLPIPRNLIHRPNGAFSLMTFSPRRNLLRLYYFHFALNGAHNYKVNQRREIALRESVGWKERETRKGSFARQVSSPRANFDLTVIIQRARARGVSSAQRQQRKMIKNVE